MSRREVARKHLLEIYQAGVLAVKGREATAGFLSAQPPGGPVCVIAIGKAAASMMRGALDVLAGQLEAGLVITKHDHGDTVVEADARIRFMESSHPVPDEYSLAAGQALLGFIAALPADAQILFLVSGGASSLVEVPIPGVTLEDLAAVTDWLLSNGVDIQSMNVVRKALSQIKGGGLLSFLEGRSAQALLISDVPGDDPGTIGSGLLYREDDQRSGLEGDLVLPDWIKGMLRMAEAAQARGSQISVPHHLIATNAQARIASAACAKSLGFEVSVAEACFEGNAEDLADEMARSLLEGPAGIHIWGGESTVMLPESPGRGGRNQHLALKSALVLAGRDDVLVLSAGTDGSDGPGEDAGALVDGGSVLRGADGGLDAERSLQAADAGSFLEASGDLINTGPSGTNVMDLVIGLKF